tara:strand:- start:7886 stop:8791 length:906 start_codon:yes stop_codon:yes gene_type:complete
MATKKSQIKFKFNCDACGFYTNNNYDYKRHVKTKKHEKSTENAKSTTNIQPVETFACECGKSYKDRTGLWRHKKKCEIAEQIIENEEEIVEDENLNEKDLVMKLIKQNGDLQKQIIDLSKETKQVTNITNQTNHFNLNLFLNDQCKNALNLIDFVNGLQISLQDLEQTGKLGYVDGISRIFVNALKDLDITERPIHCTDIKRETVYVKDKDRWEIDDKDKSKLKNSIRVIEEKNLHLLPEWQEENPNFRELDTQENQDFIQISINSLGGPCEEEVNKQQDKVLKNVIKEVAIEKKKLKIEN